MKIALTADWLTVYGGAEHVIAEFHRLWPQAPICTTVARPERLGPLMDADIRVSSLQPWYRVLRNHQLLLSHMPSAMERIDLTGYDVVISSSHAVGKGVIVPPSARHICYCHTPIRYAWEMEEEYLDDFRIPRLLRPLIRRRLTELRRWDLSASKRVDLYIANSTETQKRIERIYARDATVIPPPVDDRFFTTPLVAPQWFDAAHHDERRSFLAVGRLVPYKKFDLLIAVANARKLPLMIAGVGKEEARLKAMAGPTVTLLGFVPDEKLAKLYASARALLFPQHEDAGIVPLEAQACGTPVIAFGKGGALDSVKEGETGLFFAEQTEESLNKAITECEGRRWDPETIRVWAEQFSGERFREKIANLVVSSPMHAAR